MEKLRSDTINRAQRLQEFGKLIKGTKNADSMMKKYKDNAGDKTSALTEVNDAKM